MIIHNSFSDFALFLYVHMALADGRVHDAERNVILSKMESLFLPDKEKNVLLIQAIAAYKALDQNAILSIIKDSFGHFAEAKRDKEKIYCDMFDIINADGVVDGAETKALAALNEIINLTSVSG